MHILGVSILAIATISVIASPIQPEASEIGPRNTDIKYSGVRSSFEYKQNYEAGIKQRLTQST